MFSRIDRTVFDIPLTWNRTRFEATRTKCRHARKLIELSVNVQFKKQLTHIYLQNADIEKTINKTNENLLQHEKKVHVFDNLKEIASHSLPNHFDQRMKNVRTIIEEHCNAIQKVLHEENAYWKEIHSAIEQKLIASNDVRTIDKELSDDSPTFIEETRPLSTKHKRRSVVLLLKRSNRSLPSVNTSHVVKTDVPSREIEASPLYSQPNLPTPLCFSPTFLQDEESEPIRNVLSPLDQNKNNEFGNLTKPKVILHRVSQRFLLEHLKIDGTNDINNQPKSESTNSFAIPKPVRKIRQRKLSVSADNIIKPDTTALRKRKSVSIIEIEDKNPTQKRRRNIKIQKNKIPIQEPSPVSITDRSKHYSTRVSARPSRLNYSALSVSDAENDDDYMQPKSCSQLRK